VIGSWLHFPSGLFLWLTLCSLASSHLISSLRFSCLEPFFCRCYGDWTQIKKSPFHRISSLTHTIFIVTFTERFKRQTSWESLFCSLCGFLSLLLIAKKRKSTKKRVTLDTHSSQTQETRSRESACIHNISFSLGQPSCHDHRLLIKSSNGSLCVYVSLCSLRMPFCHQEPKWAQHDKHERVDLSYFATNIIEKREKLRSFSRQHKVTPADTTKVVWGQSHSSSSSYSFIHIHLLILVILLLTHLLREARCPYGDCETHVYFCEKSACVYPLYFCCKSCSFLFLEYVISSLLWWLGWSLTLFMHSFLYRCISRLLTLYCSLLVDSFRSLVMQRVCRRKKGFLTFSPRYPCRSSCS
jgi:hypothetical protein